MRAQEQAWAIYKGDELYGVELSEGLAGSAREHLEGPRKDSGFEVVPMLVVPLDRDLPTPAAPAPALPIPADDIASAEGRKPDRESGTFARPSAASGEAATSGGQN